MRRVLLSCALLLAGCGGASTTGPAASAPPAASTPDPPAADGGAATATSRPRAPRAPDPPGADGNTAAATSRAPAPRAPDPPGLRPARCAADAPPGCAAHTGRVIAVESVDADGDGDLHVIAAGGSVTAPGITVFDVSRALRPATDPRPGDRVTGAGPVYRGSFRQRQIEVTTFRVARASR